MQQIRWSWADKRMPFLNTEIDNVTMSEAVECVKELAHLGDGSYVVTPNADHIVKLEKDHEFAKVYAHADLILTDGKPLLWIAKWLHTPIVEKVSGSDLFPRICEMAAEEDLSVFFLGAKPGVAAKAAKILQKRYPGLYVCGTFRRIPVLKRMKTRSLKYVRYWKKRSRTFCLQEWDRPNRKSFIIKSGTDCIFRSHCM